MKTRRLQEVEIMSDVTIKLYNKIEEIDYFIDLFSQYIV